jgi:hypothetical protein
MIQGAMIHAAARALPVLLSSLAACTPSGSSPVPVRSSPEAPSAAAIGTPAEPFVRACESRVTGDLAKDWRKHSVVVGSIAFVSLPGAATLPGEELEPLPEGWRSVKTLAVVEPDAEVTASIAESDRVHAALLYDPASFKQFNAYDVAEGDFEVTFRACEGTETQFNGGFIVDGPGCITLNVRSARGPVRSVVVSFGSGDCQSRA